MHTLSELLMRGDPDQMRPWVATRLNDRLAADQFTFRVIPNPADMNINPWTSISLYPHKMSFVGVLQDGAKFTLLDIISINQTPDDLDWSIAATYPHILALAKRLA